MAKRVVLTGDRPTGRLHLGHYAGSIQNRIRFQDDCEQFLMVADMQALTDNAERPEKVKEAVHDVTLDNLAAGVDPEKTVIFIQSMIPEIAELALLFMNLVTLARIQRNPTVKAEMKEKGYGENVPVGFLTYPISQAADILAFHPDIVPVGEDQLPVIEQTNEIVEKFNRLYGKNGSIFERVEAYVPSHAGGRLPGIDGRAKMSKSLGNCIYLSDEPDAVKEKVMNMYTDPGHIHARDPGRIEGNTVFTYLDIFDTDTAEVMRLKEHYRCGGLGDVALKERLAGVLEEVIAPIRKRRRELGKRDGYVTGVLRSGTERAALVARKTLGEAKKAMGMAFSD